MPLTIIVLDFDGVVVESTKIKHEAFAELFKDYPQRELILQYHHSHNGVNRHDKFRYIMENILGVGYSDSLALEWAKRFSELTRERIIHCPFVEGALDFLESFYEKFPLYLASATPLDELRIIVSQRGIEKYFTGVYGAPMKKTAMFTQIMRKEKTLPSQMLFIGDSREDFAAAQECGIPFIARISDNNFEGMNVTKYFNLKEIKLCVGK